MELGSPRISNSIALFALIMVLVGFYTEPAKLNAIWPNVLTYETPDFKCESDTCELEVKIYNGGWATQRDLRFELPTYSKEYRRIWSNRGYKVLTDDNKKTLDLGLLHPGQQRYVSVYYPREVEKGRHYPTKFFFEIYSADVTASYSGTDDPYALKLPWWWYMTTFCTLGLTVIALVARLFERPKDRYIRLLRERDKHLSEYVKVKKKIAKNAAQLATIPENVIDAAERQMDGWWKWLIPKTRRGSVKTPFSPA